ncbi:hypothetical protein SEA_EASTWEST_51 [Arthrobacter phage EastWest]|uniref:Uncharacterized protein n=1 Tax=Arthrobacter phage EastWest TaxID=2894292 RepID=A0AAE9C974_9CAUD|nr:hypothetical protein SEA_EASTWEST_51 [Arthrobacter phage EastWest]
MSDFATTTTRTAAKQHRCEECWRTIEQGEKYTRSAGVWEGDFWTLKACAQCDRLRWLIARVDGDFYESMFGGVHAWVGEDFWNEIDASWLVRLHMRRLCMLFMRQWRGVGDELQAASLRIALEDKRGHQLVQRILDRKAAAS